MLRIPSFRWFSQSIVLGVVFLFCASAHADSVGINFSGGRSDTPDAVPLTDSDVAGVVPQANWNNASTGSGSTGEISSPNSGVVITNTGSATSIALDWTSTNTYAVANNTTRTPANAQMLNGYLDNTAAATPTTVNVSNIPYALYDVYAYVGSDANGRTGVVQVTAPGGYEPIYYVTASNNPFTSYDGLRATATTQAEATSALYAKFNNVSGSSFTLTNTRVTGNSGLHGIQIVQVPEPGAAALGLACMGLLAMRRRRRSDTHI